MMEPSGIILVIVHSGPYIGSIGLPSTHLEIVTIEICRTFFFTLLCTPEKEKRTPKALTRCRFKLNPRRKSNVKSALSFNEIGNPSE